MQPTRLAPYLLLALALLPRTGAAQAPLLEISGANFRPLPIAIPPAQALADDARPAATAFDEAFLFDATAAGIFQVLDRKSFLADAREGFTAASITFSRWADVGAEALVKVQLAVDGTNLRGEMRLFSVASGKEELRLVHVVPLSEPRKLAHFFADALYRQFTREPGPFQSHLAFIHRVGKNREIWLSDWDGRDAVVIAKDGLNVLPAVAPGGNAVAFTSYRTGKPDLYLERPGAPPVSLVSTGQMATGVAYSPDGKHIAYSLAQGDGTNIWLANADGSAARQVTDTVYFINSSPSWSPDGKRLAFVSTRAGSPQLYVLSLDNPKDPRRITFQGNYNQTPSWSPRGDLIAFTARDERNAFDLFTVNVDSGKVTRLTQDQGNNSEPTFSPNGRLIVFTSTRNGLPQLFVMTAEGQNQMALPMERGEFDTADWGP
ncbi:MAG: DPP IV N-terminal domain-containing protein [Myxococcaceae bacterium]